MNSFCFSIRRLALSAAALAALGVNHAWGETVKARLSSPTAAVGEPIGLSIQLDNVSPPISTSNTPQVDGLNISTPGYSEQVQITNGSAQSSVILNYTIHAERAGTYTIPALHFRANGHPYETEPVTLKVEAQKSDGGGGQDNRWAWLEINLPKSTAYVGEVIPLELDLYVDMKAQPQLDPQYAPTLEGEGFTTTKLSEPRGDQVVRDGRAMARIVSEASITPTQAGVIKVGKANFPYIGVPPRAKPTRPRSAFGSPFGEDFFNDPFGMFAQPERRTAVADPVELTVKPLPAQGKPANYSGAVGTFQFSGEGSPRKVQIGDPITMKLKLSGSGSFDRAGAPVLRDPTGWHVYPASTSFKADNVTGISGTKTYEIAVIPETNKKEMPVFEFSYFDPVSEKYVTRTTDAAPLEVTGSAPAATPVPAAPATQTVATTTPAKPTPPPAPTDIHGIAYDFGSVRSFTPLYLSRLFQCAQALPAGLLAAGLFLRLRKPKADAGRAAELRRERAGLLSRLRREENRSEFYDAAARIFQIDTALATGGSPDAIDGAACRARAKTPEAAALVERIFHVRAEALYAGSGSGAPEERLPDAERGQILSAIECL